MPEEYTEMDEQGRVRERFSRDSERRLEGVATSYDESGQVLQESHWRAGQLHGPTTVYAPGGQVVQRVMFKEGRLEGPAALYDEEGRATLQVSFREGLTHGELVAREGGELLVKQSLAEGRPDGPLELYKEGRLEHRALFHKGKLLGRPEEGPPKAAPAEPEQKAAPQGWLQDWLRGGAGR